MIESGRQSDGLFNFNDVLPTLLGLAGETERLPADRYIDGVFDPASPLYGRYLAPGAFGRSM